MRSQLSNFFHLLLLHSTQSWREWKVFFFSAFKGGLISDFFFHFGSNIQKRVPNHYPEHLLFGDLSQSDFFSTFSDELCHHLKVAKSQKDVLVFHHTYLQTFKQNQISVCQLEILNCCGVFFLVCCFILFYFNDRKT